MTPGLQCKHLASDCSHTLISANAHCCDSQLGINKLIYAFNPDYMPGVDEVDMVPYNTMHVELDGIVRQELAYMLYIFVTPQLPFGRFLVKDCHCLIISTPHGPHTARKACALLYTHLQHGDVVHAFTTASLTRYQ